MYDVLEVIQPPSPDPKLTLPSLLASGRLQGEAGSASRFRSFTQKLLMLDPQERCPPKEALSSPFFTGISSAQEGQTTLGGTKQDETKPEPKTQLIPKDAGGGDQQTSPSFLWTKVESTEVADCAEVAELLREGEAALAEKKVGFGADTEGMDDEPKPKLKRVQTGFVRAGDKMSQSKDLGDDDEDDT